MGDKSFTTEEARAIGEAIGIDWGNAPFDIEQFRMGMDVEALNTGPTIRPRTSRTMIRSSPERLHAPISTNSLTTTRDS